MVDIQLNGVFISTAGSMDRFCLQSLVYILESGYDTQRRLVKEQSGFLPSRE